MHISWQVSRAAARLSCPLLQAHLNICPAEAFGKPGRSTGRQAQSERTVPAGEKSSAPGTLAQTKATGIHRAAPLPRCLPARLQTDRRRIANCPDKIQIAVNDRGVSQLRRHRRALHVIVTIRCRIIGRRGSGVQARHLHARPSRSSAAMSGLSFRKVLAFSRPWPMRWIVVGDTRSPTSRRCRRP